MNCFGIYTVFVNAANFCDLHYCNPSWTYLISMEEILTMVMNKDLTPLKSAQVTLVNILPYRLPALLIRANYMYLHLIDDGN